MLLEASDTRDLDAGLVGEWMDGWLGGRPTHSRNPSIHWQGTLNPNAERITFSPKHSVLVQGLSFT